MPKANMAQYMSTTIVYKSCNITINIQTHEMENITKSIENEFSRKMIFECLTKLETNLGFEKKELFPIIPQNRNSITIITKNNTPMIVESGSTALDVAFNIHSELGLFAKSAIVNEIKVPLRFEISEFDHVVIVKGEDKNYNRDRLVWLRTKEAIKKLKSNIRKQEQITSIKDGEQKIEKIRKQFNLHRDSLNTIYEIMIKQYGYSSKNEIKIDFGKGKFPPKFIKNIIRKETLK